MSDPLALLILGVLAGGLFLVIGALPAPWWIPRRRSGPLTNRGQFGGPSPFVHCEKTGKWFDRKTGEEVKSVTFTELLAKHYCPCGDNHE